VGPLCLVPASVARLDVVRGSLLPMLRHGAPWWNSLDHGYHYYRLILSQMSLCRCLITDSLPRGYPGQLFGLRRMLELDGERRDSRFILVRAFDRDRVIAICPVDVSLCIGLIVLYRLLLQGCPQPLFISIEKAVVRLQS
jgi:hypothetical protein